MISEPILSICIPAYKGVKYLPRLLEAATPQLTSLGDFVEFLIVDDTSKDGTTELVSTYLEVSQVRYFENPENLGMSPNIVQCATQHARGKFVWIWSQHCLVRPGGLSTVMTALQSFPNLEAFYVNFLCASYPEDWPDSAPGGYDGPSRYPCRPDYESKRLGKWEELLTSSTAVCTQTYAHIIRRSLCQSYWADKVIGREFSNARDTYAQTCAVAESMFGKPCGYIGEPVFTIFNGAQTWSSLPMRSRVYLAAHPDLLRIYRRLGWTGPEFRKGLRWSKERAASVVLELSTTPRVSDHSRVAAYLFRYGWHPAFLMALWRAFLASELGVAHRFRKGIERMRALADYCFVYSRPARWIRSKYR